MRYPVKSSLLVTLMMFNAAACSKTLEEALPELIQQHHQIQTAQEDVLKAKHTVKQARSDFYPTVKVTVSAGFEDQLKPSGSDTREFRNTDELNIKQLVYDFGQTGARLDNAKLGYIKEEMTLEKIKQEQMFNGIQVYLDLLRNAESLRYSQRSEANIKRQTGMEEAKVRRGSGLSTDVLQSKSQLAGAQSARVRAEGSLIQAINRYHSAFYEGPDPTNMAKPHVPFEKLPKTIDEAIEAALFSSLKVRLSKLDVAAAQAKVKESKGKMAPRFDATAYRRHKHNEGGTVGTKEENMLKLDMSYDLFAGGKHWNNYQASKKELHATNYKLATTEKEVIESIRNAWQSLLTSRANAQFRRNQANISGEFLDNARKERQLGNRSLRDVLNGETKYIEALSAAVSAETDMAISAFSLLKEMGQLYDDVLEKALVPGLSDADLPLNEGFAQQDNDAAIFDAKQHADAREFAKNIADNLDGHVIINEQIDETALSSEGIEDVHFQNQEADHTKPS